MLDHVVDGAIAAGLAPVVAVVGADRQLGFRAVRRVVNPDPARGLSSSLQVGLAELSDDPSVKRAVVLPGDQPLVSPVVIRHLLASVGDKPITVPRYADGQPGNPVVLARSVWPLAAQLSGDRGMVQLFDRHPDLVRYIDVGGTNPDIDEPAALYSLERKAIVAAGYDALAGEYVAWGTRVHDPVRARMVDELMRRLPVGAAVLDLGCGAGAASTGQLATKFDITGVDISARQLDAAQRAMPQAKFIQADMTAVDFPSGSFDGVVALYSLIHVPRNEHPALIVSITRWLRPGGVLLAALSADDSPDWTGDWLGEPMFFSGFDAATNRRLLTDAAFDLLIDDEVEIDEPEGPARFLWVLARRRP
jgi:CTP:molybdopterin cytidylyltransferase MocA/protein-L-isoaspartate O-methyltransferase